jgi:hypothetical protein
VRRVSEPLSAYMTTRDIAAFLGVKQSTVTAYVARGQFPAPDAVIGSTKLWNGPQSKRGRHVVQGRARDPDGTIRARNLFDLAETSSD